MSAIRTDIWRDLMEKRKALSAAIDAAHCSTLQDFTTGDRSEWEDIEHALRYEPQAKSI